MRPEEQQRLVSAVAFALGAHADQTRKGKDVPYASHLLAVAALVFEAGGDVGQAVAALLHDSVEDCPDVELSQIEARFGADVAATVDLCSDLLPGDTPDAKAPWAERKARYLARLRDADARTRLVAACDKLHNLRSLVLDLDAEGRATLERFSASPARTRWYYESVGELLGPALPPALRADFAAQLARLAAHVPELEAP